MVSRGITEKSVLTLRLLDCDHNILRKECLRQTLAGTTSGGANPSWPPVKVLGKLGANRLVCKRSGSDRTDDCDEAPRTSDAHTKPSGVTQNRPTEVT